MVTKLTIKIHTDSHFPDFYWFHPKFKATSYNTTLPIESFFPAEAIIVSSGENKIFLPRKKTHIPIGVASPYQAVCHFIGHQFQILTF